MTTAAAHRLHTAACLAVLTVAAGGCARTASDRPDLRLPSADPGPRLETRENSGSDVRTINSTGNAPNGPVSPGGSTPGSRGGGGFGGDVGGPGSAVPVPRQSPAYAPLLAFADHAGASLLADPPADAPGYRTVGGVLAEVNGRPIYTDEVIAARRPELRGLAVKLPRDKFLAEARRVLGDEVRERVKNELYRLMGERNLRPEDRQKVVFLTTQWRVRQITDAGGSEAMARQRALADGGASLEQQTQTTYGRFVLALFTQLVLEPRATPSADEVRDYFRRHRDEFATKGTLQFLLIDVNAAEEPEKAKVKADHVHELAAGGEDFEALARGFADSAFYKQSGGHLANPDPIAKGEVAWPELEAALWQTPEGGVTPVVSARGGTKLLVAKLVEKHLPKQADFADAQGAISGMIKYRRMDELLAQYLKGAQSYAAVTPEAQMERAMQTAMEVVDQEYDALRAE